MTARTERDVQFVSGAATMRCGYPGYVAGATFAQALGWQGAQVQTSYAACASGAQALSAARSKILSGECEVALVPMSQLPPSLDALAEEEPGQLVFPENQPLPATYMGRGRGALLALSAVGLFAFFLPWVELTAPETVVYTVATVTLDKSSNAAVAASTIGEFYGLARTPANEFYVADYFGNRIRQVTGNNQTTVIAGSGEYGRNNNGVYVLTGPKLSTPVPHPLFVVYDSRNKVLFTGPDSYDRGRIVQAFGL